MDKPSMLLIFIFSLIDSFFYIFLLSNSTIGDKKQRTSNIIFILILSMFITSLTLYDVPPNIKVIIISAFMLIPTTFLYNLKLNQRILAIILYYFILIASELLVTFIASNLMDLNGDISQSKYAYLYLGLISKFVAFFILINVNKFFLNKKFILPKLLNLIMILALVLSISSMIFVYYSSIYI